MVTPPPSPSPTLSKRTTFHPFLRFHSPSHPVEAPRLLGPFSFSLLVGGPPVNPHALPSNKETSCPPPLFDPKEKDSTFSPSPSPDANFPFTPFVSSFPFSPQRVDHDKRCSLFGARWFSLLLYVSPPFRFCNISSPFLRTPTLGIVKIFQLFFFLCFFFLWFPSLFISFLCSPLIPPLGSGVLPFCRVQIHQQSLLMSSAPHSFPLNWHFLFIKSPDSEPSRSWVEPPPLRLPCLLDNYTSDCNSSVPQALPP